MSSDLGHFLSLEVLQSGGLFQVSSPQGGSTQFALDCLKLFFGKVDPPSSPLAEHYAWIADEGYLYPVALAECSSIPVSRLLLVKARDANETWRLGLEAIQTGLFGFVFLRPSRSCDSTHLRRLQLMAERTKTRVFLLGQLQLPHWVLKHSFQLKEWKINEADSLLSKRRLFGDSGGGLSFAYA